MINIGVKNHDDVKFRCILSAFEFSGPNDIKVVRHQGRQIPLKLADALEEPQAGDVKLGLGFVVAVIENLIFKGLSQNRP